MKLKPIKLKDNSFILIDTEAKIVEGDYYYNIHNKVVTVATSRYGELRNPLVHRKIIASTNELIIEEADNSEMHAEIDYRGSSSIPEEFDKCLPQLSNTSKLLLINYYTKHKCMPENVCVPLRTDCLNCDELGNELCAIICQKKVMPTTLKLNQQGEIEITILENRLRGDFLDAANELFESKIIPKVEEKLYTEEEVVKLLDSFQDDLTMLGDIKGYNTEIWFNSKKK